MEGKEKWGILYKGKIIPVSDSTIRWIRQDPTEVWGWFETELMVAWKNIFPLTERSKQLGYLPLKDEAWITTPNPWWRFLTDRPPVPSIPMTNSGPSATRSVMQNSEKILLEAEAMLTEAVISETKKLINFPVECLLMGSLHRVKMIQFAEPRFSGTVVVKATQGDLGIIMHSVTLIKGIWESRKEMLEVWRLRNTDVSSSLAHEDVVSTPSKMMNILIWNCRGAMKPQFRKTVMDLVEWHAPILMVITETRMSGARADEIIESLPFDGHAVADTIGFAGGIWLLWRSDLVNVDVLAATEQEIHALIREPCEGVPQHADKAHI
ncbi:uncharacterized protein LOC126695284 [Quercus robur]|uniref:uncharacterized protein LOC126695284 n=1 Tax=Quercus robur TaxID=38942 RepID=UPI0021635127|nr:uncharacterized protein LOC126695284 [Quercus robur]